MLHLTKKLRIGEILKKVYLAEMAKGSKKLVKGKRAEECHFYNSGQAHPFEYS